MGFDLRAVDVRENISRDEFQKEYFIPKKPVLLKSYSSHWPAKKKWSLEYFKKTCGNIDVPLYSEAFANSGKSYLDAQEKMKFKDYLDLIEKGPTKKRMFLFNIFKHMPELCEDFDFPPICDGYFKKMPFMFFGGATSYVDAHIDLDLSHVFITQFQGKKKVILFDPNCSSQLYRHPFTVSTNVDIGNPDFKKYPKLNGLKGYECTIDNGDTLYMPSGYWHYIYYEEGGFALSLRSNPKGIAQKLKSLKSISSLLVIDRGMTKILGAKRWYQMKEDLAHKSAAKS